MPEVEPLNVRVRVAEVLQRLALQVTNKSEREVINREAYKYATGQELLQKEPELAKPERYWTAEQISKTLKWPADAVLHRAESLHLTDKPAYGYWDGDIFYFGKEGRQKLLELIRDKIVKIENGFATYEDGHRYIYWRSEA